MTQEEYQKLEYELWKIINIEDHNISITLNEDSALVEFIKEQLILEISGIEEAK